MKRLKILLLTIGLVILITSCSKNQTANENSGKDRKNNKDKKEDATNQLANNELSKYDLDSKDPVILRLPKELKEISGITMTPDGRLFAEQDEQGIVYQIDIKTGDILKRFFLGDPPIRKDFEDIVYINNKFYLLNSTGNIYECEEGENGQTVDYKIYETGLSAANDVEGMCFDLETNSLLLACKGISGVDDEKDKAVYSFSLDSMKLSPEPRFMIKKSDIKNYFNPSGIQRNPKTGTFFIIAANGNEIVEISKDGEFIGKHELLKGIHFQPEGITFSPDNSLLISNEGKNIGSIVMYPYKN